MSKFPYLPLCIDAYRNDTAHLTLEQHGAYLTLLMMAWRSPGCRLPDDDTKLARMLGITRKKWAGMKDAVMEFWVLEDGFWTQGRLAKEHEYVSRKSEQNRSAGAKGGAAKALKSKEPAVADAIANALALNTLHITQEKNIPDTDVSGPAEVEVISSAGIIVLPNPRLELFGRGKKLLANMTGRPERSLGGLVAKWLKATNEDAVKVLRAIEDAARGEVAEPISWIEAALKQRPMQKFETEAERNRRMQKWL